MALVLRERIKRAVVGNKQAGRLSIKMIFIEGTKNEINKFYEVDGGACCCQEVRPFPVDVYACVSVQISNLVAASQSRFRGCTPVQRKVCSSSGSSRPNFLLIVD